MPLDARIPLAAEAPQPTSLSDLLKNRLNIQSAIQQRQSAQQSMELNRVRTDQERLDNDIKRQQIARGQEDQADDEVYHQTMATVDPGKADWSNIRGQLATKVKPRNLARYDAEMAKSVEAWSKANTERRKADEDIQKTVGESLVSVKSAPPEERQNLWTSEKARLAAKGVIDPSKIPDQVPDDNGLDAMLRQNGAWGNYQSVVKKEHDNKMADLKERDSRENTMHAEFARDMQGVDTAESYDATVKAFADKDEEHQAYANRFLKTLKFDPKITPKVVNHRAMTATERETADRLENSAENRPLEVALRRARAELGPDADEADVAALQQKYYAQTEQAKKLPRATGTAKGSGKDDRGFTPTQVKADQQRHEHLQSEENKAWRLVEAYKAELGKKDEEDVTDPGRTASARRPLADVREEFQNKLKEAREKALDLQREKKTIRTIHGWDDQASAPAASGSAATSTDASAKAAVGKPAIDTAPPVKLLREGIATKFKNGQTWTLKNGIPVKQ